MRVAVEGTTTYVSDVYIVASTNTDIPTYYSKWLNERHAEGSVELPAYVDPERTIVVSLLPEDVKGYVFYSKNYGPFLRFCTPFVDSPTILFFTVGDAAIFQARVSPFAKLFEQARALRQRFAAGEVIWKLPPLFFDRDGRLLYADNLESVAAGMRAAGVEKCMLEAYSSGFNPQAMRERLRLHGIDDFVEAETPARLEAVAALIDDLNRYNFEVIGNESPLFPDLRVSDIENRIEAFDIGRMGMPCPTKCLYCDTNFTVNYDSAGEQRQRLEMDPAGHSVGLEPYFRSLGLDVDDEAPADAASPYAIELRARCEVRQLPSRPLPLLVNVIGDRDDHRRAYLA